jgi:hypothetical protein
MQFGLSNNYPVDEVIRMRSKENLIYLLADPVFFDTFDHYSPKLEDFYLPVTKQLPPGWSTQRRDVWFNCVPPVNKSAAQGWKIHLSAIGRNALEVLKIVVPILRDRETQFKFALDQMVLSLLNGKTWARGGAGKFITIYPSDIEDFKSLIETLHVATRKFEGPYILSDRRYKDSKVVYYRYGGIRRFDVVNGRGEKVPSIVGPDGKPRADKRLPYFDTPEWVQDPFGDHEPDLEGQEPSVKDGRYLIEQALAFTNAGGVYLGSDRQTGKTVVIKEARPWVNWVPGSGDAVDLLGKEYRLLSLLEDTGISPKPVDFFKDWEHHFLVEEHILGLTLSDHAADYNLVLRTRPSPEDSLEFGQLYKALFLEIINIIEVLHSKAIIFSDLSSRNLLVQKGTTRVKVIDFEAAYQEGRDVPRYLFTPGFASLDQMSGKRPNRSSDYYSLGALALSYLMPINSVGLLNPDIPRRFLKEMQADFGLSAGLRETVLAMLEEDESKRLTARDLKACLTQERAFVPASMPPHKLPQVDQALLARLAEALVCSATYDRSDRLFPGDAKGFLTNHLGVAHGACGVMYTLHKMGHHIPEAMMQWLMKRPMSAQDLPPGFFSGLAGIAWVLRELGATREAERALLESDNHPELFEHPDLYYGAAGWGIAHLQFFADTGDEYHLQQASRAAEYLRTTEQKSSEGSFWKVENDVPIGLAHGASGIALFLLYLYLATGDESLLDLGQNALQFDLNHGVRTRDGGISWPSKVGLSAPVYPYWRYGTAGIGKAVIRYSLVLPQEKYAQLVEQIYLDIDRKYALYPGFFNGLAGLCDLLLDLHHFTGEERYYRSAGKALEGIRLFMFEREGQFVTPGDGLMRLSYDYGTGLAGVAAIAHRYFTQSGASFLPDRAFDSRCLSLKVVA